MKTYFFSGHISVARTNQICSEFSGLVNANDAMDAFHDVYAAQLRILQRNGEANTHVIVMDAFNVVEDA